MKQELSEQLKQKFVKPTGENQKIILYKDIRSKKATFQTGTLRHPDPSECFYNNKVINGHHQ